MKNDTKIIACRVNKKLLQQFEEISKTENRTIANILECLVTQYMEATGGKLLKKIKIVPDEVVD